MAHYDSVVAARVRVAEHIQSSPELLAQFEAHGGLSADLMAIVTQGQAARAAHRGGASDSIASLQREYQAVMNVMRIVRDGLAEEDRPDVIGPKKALAKKSHEEVRAAIEQDAGALLASAHAAAPLEARRVTPERLTKLRDDAAALAGQVATTKLKKADRRGAHAGERAAVEAQTKTWRAVRPLIAAIDDLHLEQLAAAARR